MDRVKFYSENDMVCGLELNKIVNRINEKAIEKEWTIADVIEFYNILKYVQVEHFTEYLIEKTGVNIEDYLRKIQKKIGEYLSRNRSEITDKYDELDFDDTEDFLEIIEKYSVYKDITEISFKSLLEKEYVHIYFVLKYKKITEHFDNVVRDKILSDSINAETIISKYLNESKLYLPPSLSDEDMLKLIDNYIDSSRVNINILRKIIHFPTGKGFNMPDKIKLHAKRREKEESERIFSKSIGIESSVSVTYDSGIDEAILVESKGSKVDIVVNRKWVEENMDYPTLWNNFIYLFDIVDMNARLTLTSKTHDMSTLEAAIRPPRNHIYNTSFSFSFREMVANAQVYSYIQVLNELGVRLEDMIEWFFNDYINAEFSISNFVVKMPTEASSFFEKCRTILPELDRIFKQYNVLIEDGEIDQELIQLSSTSIKNKDIKSFMSRKYAYPIKKWYETASFLLFSDQSRIFYIPQKDEKYKNFLDLIIRDNVTKAEFKDYQLERINWLFENGVLFENEERHIKVADVKTIFILKELYYKDVLNYWNYQQDLRDIIDNMESKEIISFESTLLTRNEQDYLNFYLNKAKFTNGYDLRNRYLHGTNVNDEKQYELDYYSILKLFIIIIIKINDDLCISDIHSM